MSLLVLGGLLQQVLGPPILLTRKHENISQNSYTDTYISKQTMGFLVFAKVRKRYTVNLHIKYDKFFRSLRNKSLLSDYKKATSSI